MSIETKVNLKYMLKVSERISKIGFNISERFDKFLFQVKTMQEYWQGEAYIEFVRNVNRKIEIFTDISNYYTEMLPKEIISKRNMYARKINEVEDDVNLNKPVGLNKLIIKEQGNIIIYKSSAMEIKINRIEQIFDDIIRYLKEIQEDFNSIIWEGTLKILMKQSFEEKMIIHKRIIKSTKQAFYDYLEKQMREMDKAEKDNSFIEQHINLSDVNTKINIESSSYDWEKNVF